MLLSPSIGMNVFESYTRLAAGRGDFAGYRWRNAPLFANLPIDV